MLLLMHLEFPNLTGSRMQRMSAQHPHLLSLSLSALQLHMPDICIDQRQRSHEEEVGSVLNLRLNHIKTALCNFLNNLTRAAPTETDHALCPNIEPCPPNGRENRRFVSLHAILALYCLAGIIAAFHDFLLGALLFICHNH